MLKGEIEVHIRDAETLELVEKREQKNIVLNTMFAHLTGSLSPTIPKVIAVSTKRFSPSRTANRIPTADNTWTTSTGPAIPGRSNPEWFDKNGDTPMFIQWSARIDVPVQNRQINTIFLTDITQPSYLSQNSSLFGNAYGQAYAYAKLAAPCNQSTTQIMDVFYRIYFPEAALAGLPKNNLTEIAKRLAGLYGESSGIYGNVYGSQFRLPTLKYGDDNNVIFQGRGYFRNNFYLAGNGLFSSAGYYKRRYSHTWGLNWGVGFILADLGVMPQDQDVSGFSALTGNIRLPNTLGKIQNVFGRKSFSGHVWLDVDNLPIGSGKVLPSGSWQNADTPKAAGLYYSGKWPSQVYVSITNDGQVGIAKYKIKKRPYLGQVSSGLAGGGYNALFATVPALCSGRNIQHNFIGDMAKFGIRQMSSIVKYDDVSVVIPLQNQIMLYNLACSDYWRYNAAWSNIGQIAVANEKIYVACRDTGLWVIDPKNSNDVVSLASPGSGVDLSRCYGVTEGYNGCIWAVGANGVAKLEKNGAWTLYNETSTPAFSFAGISNAKWSNIEYIKANAATAAGELFLVRTKEADIDNGIVGLWWSLAGVASNGPSSDFGNGTASSVGHMRVNRSHIGCSRDGQWIGTHSGCWRAMSFGTTTLGVNIQTYNGDIYSDPTTPLASVMFEKNAGGIDKLLTICKTSVYNSITFMGHGNVILRNADNTIDTRIDDSTTLRSALRFPNYPYETQYVAPQSSGIGSASYDYNVAINMGNGIVFSMGFFDKQTNQNWGELVASLWQWSMDRNMHEGSLSHVHMQQYGWDSAQEKWVIGNNNDKVVHSDAQPLIDGLSIAFANGAGGTSFISGETYNFALCEGLAKDNATTNTIEVPFYYKKAYQNVTELTSNTVPLTAAINVTGQVGLDIGKSSSTDMVLNADGTVTFLDENGQVLAVGDKQVVGDFEVRYDLSNSADMRDVFFGLGYNNVGYVGTYWYIDNVGNIGISYIDQSNNRQSLTTKSGDGAAIGTTATITSVAIKRVGTSWQFFANGVQFTPNASGTSLPATTPLGRMSWDLVCGPSDKWQASRQVANRKTPKTTIVTNGASNLVRAGNQLAGTASFNPKFYAIDTDLKNGIVATLNGAPATIRTDYAAPGPMEISVDPFAGTFVFNAVDEAKSLSIRYTYMTHE